jgi:Uri superfamily endonuclease
MEVESHHSTYALVLRVIDNKLIDVGALGYLEFKPGFYIYVGSAFGSGGLRGRLTHHLSSSKKSHWHIDYLRQQANLSTIWYTYDSVRREHQWAKVLVTMPEMSVPLPGFGSSDCRCNAHLFFIPTEPSLVKFYERLLVCHPGHEAILNCVLTPASIQDNFFEV